MKRDKKRGKKDRDKSERNAAESSATSNVTNKGKNSMTASSDVTIKTEGSSGNKKASSNTLPNMAEKKPEKEGNEKSFSIFYAAMQSDAELSKNKDKNATDKDIDNPTSHSQEVALPTMISKKKRIRNCRKSAPGTSEKKELASAEYEGNTLDCSDTFLDNVDMHKLIAARISTIESAANEPKSIKYMYKYKVDSSLSQEEKQKTTFNTGDENVNYSSKGKLVPVSANKSKTHDSIKLVKKDNTISSCLTLKTARSAGNSHASSNPPQNMAEREREKENNVLSVTYAEMQSDAELSKNNDKNATGKDSDNPTSHSQEVAPSTVKSGKKRKRKSRRKSASGISGTGLAGAEYEGNTFDCSYTFLDNDLMQKLISARILTLESGATEPKSIECMHKYKVNRSPSQESKRNITFNTRDENVEHFSKENQITIFDNDSKTDDFIRPVIFVTDKSTQTDPLQEPPNISKHTDNKDNSALNTDSDRTVRAEAAESDLLLPPQESNLENALKDNDIWKKTGSNLSSLDQSLQSIKEDFLRHLKILSENFEDQFYQIFKE